jgi:osmoprotectant transport system ATP-binding protein
MPMVIISLHHAGSRRALPCVRSSGPAGVSLVTEPVIEIDRMTKCFAGARSPAVRDLSLTVEGGRLVALVGASGSGKTTTLKTINRLIEPDSGEIRVEGHRIRSVNAPELRRRIGYVFQDIGLFPHLRIGENIGITPQLLGWDPKAINTRVAELLDLVALPQAYAMRFPDALSGGERQRVGVARAIAARPKIVLMDEPFGALDPITRDALGWAYRRLHDDLKLTTVMVTHDVQQAVLLADQIVVMGAGRILANDTPRALLAGHENADVAALMAMPKRQTEQIAALLETAPGAGGHG